MGLGRLAGATPLGGPALPARGLALRLAALLGWQAGVERGQEGEDEGRTQRTGVSGWEAGAVGSGGGRAETQLLRAGSVLFHLHV